MKRLVPMTIAALALVAPFGALQASGDYGCEPRWKLASQSYDTCGSRALLSPGNDTRVNLYFLLRDRQGMGARGPATYPEPSDVSVGRNFFGWGTLRQAYYREEPDPMEQAHYGSRCISLASGAAAFGAAMTAASGLPATERDALIRARDGLVQRCTGEATAGPSWPTVQSASGRAFRSYIEAADAFYAGQWDGARSGFGQLRASRDPWLAETSRYMLARTELNAAQDTSFDEWGSLLAGQADKPALGRARVGFDDYLKRYARGRYAESARGLVRRILWLSGDADALAAEYERLLGTVPAAQPAAADLVQEIDNKLLMASAGKIADGKMADGRSIDGPLLLATIDLMMMRTSDGDGSSGEAAPPLISAEAIAGQAGRFGGRPDLYGFVQASHAFYVDKNPAKVLRLIADDARRPDYAPLAFSRQVLRGMALAAGKDRAEAGFWQQLLSGAKGAYQRPLIELALAMNYERSGRLGDVFAAGSPIAEAPVREILLMNVAGPDLLRAQVGKAGQPQHERDLALFTLLRKQLAYGDYTGFLGDRALIRAEATSEAISEGGLWDLRAGPVIPVGLFRDATWSDGFACPALAATAGTLARDPRDVKARLCLGEFYRLNGFDGYDVGITSPKPDELGGTPSLFRGTPTTRADIYSQIIAHPGAGPDKAYALFRAVNCYAPSGINACGGPDAPQSQRQGWFNRLKREFPTSSWARQLRYYW